jgi:hypothetical protein
MMEVFHGVIGDGWLRCGEAVREPAAGSRFLRGQASPVSVATSENAAYGYYTLNKAAKGEIGESSRKTPSINSALASAKRLV